ncbi:MAG: sigma factor, partial [Planctomycetota bacterium]
MAESFRKTIVQEISRHQSRLRAFVRCLVVRSSDVEDILQDVNAVLWEKADEFQPGTDFWAWAIQIAV